MSSERSSLISARPPGLVDVLDRILDKGLVVAGDIKVSLANVELLTLQIRLLVCSIDKAEQIGLNWWRYDSNLTTRAERAKRKTSNTRAAGRARQKASTSAPSPLTPEKPSAKVPRQGRSATKSVGASPARNNFPRSKY